MTEDGIAEAQRLQAMVVAVLNGAASVQADQLGGTAIDGTLMLQAFQFIGDYVACKHGNGTA